MSILFVGCGGHANSVKDALNESSVGFLDDNCVDNPNVIGKIDTEGIRIAKELGAKSVCVTIGDNFIRQQVVNKIKILWPDVVFQTIIHPTAYVSPNAILEEGVVVLSGAIIGPNTKVGKHCIINTKASIDHDCSMNDFSSLAPNVTLCGKVSIGLCTAICVSATVIQNLVIGDYTIIGASSLVLKNIPGKVVAFGIPIHTIKSRSIHDKYL